MKRIVTALLGPFKLEQRVAIGGSGSELEIVEERGRQTNRVPDSLIDALDARSCSMRRKAAKFAASGRRYSLSRTEQVRRMAAVSLVSWKWYMTQLDIDS